MQIALKFDEDSEDISMGLETVFFRAQMLRDVYFYEQEPLPSLMDFVNKPLRRQDEQKFWVYRQGTYIPSHVFHHGELFVGHAFTSELDEDTPNVTVEGYHHVKELRLESGGLLATADERYTHSQQRIFFEKLYEDIKTYGFR